MLSTIGSFAETTGCLPCFSSKDRWLSKNERTAKVQNLRLGCVKSFLCSIGEVAKTKEGFSDFNVLLYFHKKVSLRGRVKGDISTNSADHAHIPDQEPPPGEETNTCSSSVMDQSCSMAHPAASYKLNYGKCRKSSTEEEIRASAQQQKASLKNYGSQEDLTLIKRNVSDLSSVIVGLLVGGERFSSSYL